MCTVMLSKWLEEEVGVLFYYYAIFLSVCWLLSEICPLGLKACSTTPSCLIPFETASVTELG